MEVIFVIGLALAVGLYFQIKKFLDDEHNAIIGYKDYIWVGLLFIFACVAYSFVPGHLDVEELARYLIGLVGLISFFYWISRKREN